LIKTRQHQSSQTSIVRVRDMGFSGWCFGCIVADDTKPKRFLMKNRFGSDWLATCYKTHLTAALNLSRINHTDTLGIASTTLPHRSRRLEKADTAQEETMKTLQIMLLILASSLLSTNTASAQSSCSNHSYFWGD